MASQLRRTPSFDTIDAADLRAAEQATQLEWTEMLDRAGERKQQEPELAAQAPPAPSPIGDQLRDIRGAVDNVDDAMGIVAGELLAIRDKLEELVAEKRASPRQLTEGRVCAGVANSRHALEKIDEVAGCLGALSDEIQRDRAQQEMIKTDIKVLCAVVGEIRGDLAVLSKCTRGISADLRHARGEEAPSGTTRRLPGS